MNNLKDKLDKLQHSMAETIVTEIFNHLQYITTQFNKLEFKLSNKLDRTLKQTLSIFLSQLNPQNNSSERKKSKMTVTQYKKNNAIQE